MKFYDLSANQNTNGSAGTASQCARFLTVTQQPTAYITQVIIAARHGLAGGVVGRLNRMATAGTVGSAYTLGKRDPESIAAQTTAFTAHTAGATPSTSMVFGCPATGGSGGWVAGAIEEAFKMLPNGGANGNAEIETRAGIVTVPFELTATIAES